MGTEVGTGRGREEGRGESNDMDEERLQSSVINPRFHRSKSHMNTKIKGNEALDSIAELRIAQGKTGRDRNDLGVSQEELDLAAEAALSASGEAAAEAEGVADTVEDATVIEAPLEEEVLVAKKPLSAAEELLQAQEEISTVFSGVLSSMLTNLLTQNPQLVRRAAAANAKKDL